MSSKLKTGLKAKQSRTLGVLLTLAGSYLLYEGYEGAGKKRPFAARFLPGP